MDDDGSEAKYRRIFATLQRDLRDGRYPQGRPLPSEQALMRRFGVSRITAKRAMDELVRRGLVWRRRGSGTFATRAARAESGLLGLIMPSLSFGEVFPVICQALIRLAREDGHTFLLGDVSAASPRERAREALDVALSFAERHVAGVILQPLAFLDSPGTVTADILAHFDGAGIPAVLIDRDIDAPGDGGPRHDFVGIDNIAAGRALGAHLLAQGARRIRFLMRPMCAAVIRDRLDGVASALGQQLPHDFAIVAEPTDEETLAPVFRGDARPDAVVCESDYVATLLAATLARFGLRVPADVMLAGFDDVRFAASASPPLTTIRQPCAEVARVAYATLRERLRDASLPPRRILLPAPLVVRESTRRT